MLLQTFWVINSWFSFWQKWCVNYASMCMSLRVYVCAPSVLHLRAVLVAAWAGRSQRRHSLCHRMLHLNTSTTYLPVGDCKALQINARRCNWQQSHYCSTTGDKALCAPQGMLCGLSAAIWEWNTHREMRIFAGWKCCDPTITAPLRWWVTITLDFFIFLPQEHSIVFTTSCSST